MTPHPTRAVAPEPLESRTLLSVPPAPTGVEAALLEQRAVVVEWVDVAGESGYAVERRIDGTTEPWARVGSTAENVTRFTQDGLSPGRTYLYRVRAVNRDGVSEPSDIDAVTVPGEPTSVPAAPRLGAALVGPRAVRLEWTNVTGETGYAVERRVDGSPDPFRQVATTGRDLTAYTDDGLDPGKTYIYRVRATGESGNSPYSNHAFATTPREGTVPAAPRELDARLTDAGRVRLTWSNVDNERGYKVERRVDGTDQWAQVGTTGENVTSFVDERVERGKTYVYRVRAFNAAGNSPYSNTDAVAVPGEGTVPAAPRLEAGLAGDRAARLAWTNVANETGYRIERRIDGSAEAFRVIGTVAANVTTFTNDGLEPGRTYLYRVQAFNDAGRSAHSNIAAVAVPPGAAPDAPRELVAELVQGRFVRLRWADVSGEAGYKIERRLDGSGSGEWVQIGNTAANVVSFADERIERGRTYVYRVRAFNRLGDSPYSNTDAVTVPGETANVPAAPRLEVGVVGPRAARLAWTNVVNETGYRIERRIDGSTEGFREIRTVGADVTTVTDDGLEPGKTYVYRVRAFNAAGNSAWSNTGVASLPPAGVPTAPRELRATSVTAERVELKWLDATGETGYRIERRLDGTREWVKVGSADANATSFSDTGVAPGRTYLYRVRASNKIGKSLPSNTIVVRTPGERPEVPAAPRDLRATAVGPTRIDLQWTDVANDTGYRIERRLDGTGTWERIAFVKRDVTRFSDTTVQPGSTYIYRVRAGGAVESSAWSNAATARTPEAPATGTFSTTRIRAVSLVTQ